MENTLNKNVSNSKKSSKKQANNKAKKIPIYIKLIPYVYLFFLFSFMGWALETIYCYFGMGVWVKRGFLYSTICPIYGYGALMLTAYLDNLKTKKNYFKLFILFIIIFSVFEYFVGFMLDALFAERWWDYSNYKYNLNGRITVRNSLYWGIITIAFTRFIYPLIQKFREIVVNKIPRIVNIIIASILLGGLLVDSIFSCLKYLK